MEAIVLAGGFGTRLSHVVSDVPKPMAPVNSQPFLQYILNDLIKKGIDHIVIAVGYKKEIIMNYFGCEYRGTLIEYSCEDTPLFTGGAIKKALYCCKEEDVFIINGDTYFDVNLHDMMDAHKNKQATLTVAVKQMKEFDRYGKIEANNNDRIIAFSEKQFCELGIINGGIYIIKKEALHCIECDKFSFEKDYMEKYVLEIPMYTYESKGYFIDIGIPDDYYKSQEDLKKVSKKVNAAFFDRDGTININYGHVYEKEKLEFVQGVPEIIKEYNDKGQMVIVVTNQAGIAKGIYTIEQMNRFNKYLNQELMSRYGAHIDAFYYCPHHPDYTGDCDCRKPKPGMFIKAAKEYNIDLTESIMYGDKESDREAATSAGIKQFVLITCKSNV